MATSARAVAPCICVCVRVFNNNGAIARQGTNLKTTVNMLLDIYMIVMFAVYGEIVGSSSLRFWKKVEGNGEGENARALWSRGEDRAPTKVRRPTTLNGLCRYTSKVNVQNGFFGGDEGLPKGDPRI